MISVRGTTIEYRLRIVDMDGSYDFSPVVHVDDNADNFALHPAYPNPATGGFNVPFSLAEQTGVAITLFNMRGEQILCVFSGQSFDRGYHVVTVSTAGLSSASYLLELCAGTTRRTQIVTIEER